MLILSISDFHGAIELLPKAKKKFEEASPDIIVFSGDLLKFMASEQEAITSYFKFYEWLNSFNIPVFTVPGNCDFPTERYFKATMEAEAVYPNLLSVHGRHVRIGRDFVIGGFGGEITEKDKEDGPFVKFPSWEAKYALFNLAHVEQDKLLLLHSPPVGNVDLDKGKHIGSNIVNELINSIAPRFAFCGHAHDAKGKDLVGNTIVVNPGAFRSGNYALVDTEKKDVVHHSFL